MKVDIIGAGMAGLLAGNILQRPGDHENSCNVTIYESQRSLPNNHSAVLRFRSDIVSRALGIPFKKVSVMRGTDNYKNPIAAALNYSMKCNGEYRTDRSISKLSEGVSDRWIAPNNLIGLMEKDFLAKGGRIVYGANWTPGPVNTNPTISTMPMPVLANMLVQDVVRDEAGVRRDTPEFLWDAGYNISVYLRGVEAYASLYIADPMNPISRISITGSKVIAEIPISGRPGSQALEEMLKRDQIAAMLIRNGLELLGLEDCEWTSRVSCKRQLYSKIRPIDDRWRKNFIFDCTDKYQLYSLGRFATWRPGLLLDDLVPDVYRIKHWIEEKYLVKLARSNDKARIDHNNGHGINV